MNAEHIRVIPVLHSEDGFYFSVRLFDLKTIDRDLEAATRTYEQRFGCQPAEVRYNEVARLYELGPVPVNS